MELNNSNNNSDYIVTVTHTGEKPTPRPAMEPQSGNRLIIKIKLHQQGRSHNIKVLLNNKNNIPLFFLFKVREWGINLHE